MDARRPRPDCAGRGRLAQHACGGLRQIRPTGRLSERTPACTLSFQTRDDPATWMARFLSPTTCPGQGSSIYRWLPGGQTSEGPSTHRVGRGSSTLATIGRARTEPPAGPGRRLGAGVDWPSEACTIRQQRLTSTMMHGRRDRRAASGPMARDAATSTPFRPRWSIGRRGTVRARAGGWGPMRSFRSRARPAAPPRPSAKAAASGGVSERRLADALTGGIWGGSFTLVRRKLRRRCPFEQQALLSFSILPLVGRRGLAQGQQQIRHRRGHPRWDRDRRLP